MPLHIAIIGAGMAGLSCANALHAAGAEVTLFDKGRRPGGRLATRRSHDLRFDHGAQYATAKGAAFQQFLAEAGTSVAPWDAHSAHARWVGIPGMSAIAQAAVRRGAGTILAQRHVAFITPASGTSQPAGWHLRHLDARTIPPGTVVDEGEPAGPFDRIVIALPAPQAAGLLAALGHAFAHRVGAVEMEPCWTLMLAYDDRQPGLDTKTLEEGPLSWIARDSSRPQRPPLPDAWVANASAAWSRAHLEQEPTIVLADLRRYFEAATGIGATPIHQAAHRWRYANVAIPLGQDCLYDPAGLAVCGDWCIGGRVEAAFDSGRAAARACL